MSRVSVGFGGEWKENENDVGSQMKWLNVDISINFQDFLSEIYIISEM